MMSFTKDKVKDKRSFAWDEKQENLFKKKEKKEKKNGEEKQENK